MSDISFIFDQQKRYSDIQIVGGDFLLCDSPQTDLASIDNGSGFSETIEIVGAGKSSWNKIFFLFDIGSGYPRYSEFEGDITGAKTLEFGGVTWNMVDEFGSNDYINGDSSFRPPKTGWADAGGGGSLPTIKYENPASTTETIHNVSSLQVAVEISLFTDRRATLDEIRLVQGGIRERQSRRGYWANTFKANPQGSGLWLLQREKKTQANLARARVFCNASLKWLVDTGVVQSVSTTAEYAGDALVIVVSIIKPDGQEAGFRYQYAWDSLEGS